MKWTDPSFSDHMLGAMKWTDHRFTWSQAISQRFAKPQPAGTDSSWILINIVFASLGEYFKIFLPFLNIWDFPPIFWEYIKHYRLCLVVKMFAKNKDSNKCIACPIKHFLLRCSSFTFCGTAGRLKPSQLNSPKVEPDTFHHHPEDFYYVFLANLVAGMVKGYRYE